MSSSLSSILTWLAALLLVAGCPTRRNPDLPLPDADADADAEDDADAPVDGDAEADADAEGPCDPGEQLCGSDCVSLTDTDHCGGCDRVCGSEADCECTGDPPVCWVPGANRFCYDACAAREGLCEVGGEDECVDLGTDDNCGACGVVCEDSATCLCRDPGSTGRDSFACLERSGESWADCTESRP